MLKLLEYLVEQAGHRVADTATIASVVRGKPAPRDEQLDVLGADLNGHEGSPLLAPTAPLRGSPGAGRAGVAIARVVPSIAGN